MPAVTYKVISVLLHIEGGVKNQLLYKGVCLCTGVSECERTQHNDSPSTNFFKLLLLQISSNELVS